MKTVLIADDDPSIVISLEYLLRNAGYRVLVARDGQETYECIVRDRPDLVLLDLMLPRMSGYEVCERVRGDPATRDIPIVMLTAKGREVERAKGMALGASDYVTKPFSTSELLQHVRRHLGEG